MRWNRKKRKREEKMKCVLLVWETTYIKRNEKFCEETERKKREKYVIDHVPFRSASWVHLLIQTGREKRRSSCIKKETTILWKLYMEIDPLQTFDNNTCQLVHTRALCAVCGAPAIGKILVYLCWNLQFTFLCL